MDCLLSSLPDAMRCQLEEQLSQNLASSDAELYAHFIASGLTELQATRAIHYRRLYRNNSFLEGYTPILKGGHALRFNPARRQFELLLT
jgi:hypothetical protein